MGALNKFIRKHTTRFIPDKLYLSLLFWHRMGYLMDWDNPRTFCEKLQWLKLYDIHEEYSRLVDKYEVKKYIAQTIGEKYVIPTLGVWNSFDEIDFSKLPEQFVLKCTHDSGGVVICNNKSIFDFTAARKKLIYNLRNNFYYNNREYPYKNVKPRIIAEKYIDVKELSGITKCDNFVDLTDYKFYCFNGKPVFCQVIRNRQSNETIDFYDMEWKHQEFVGLNPNAKNGRIQVEQPKDFTCMKDICQTLAKGMVFVRIDLYNIHNQTYFGEITFYPNGGFGKFCPNEWDLKLGEMILLPTKS